MAQRSDANGHACLRAGPASPMFGADPCPRSPTVGTPTRKSVRSLHALAPVHTRLPFTTPAQWGEMTRHRSTSSMRSQSEQLAADCAFQQHDFEQRVSCSVICGIQCRGAAGVRTCGYCACFKIELAELLPR